MWNKYCPGCCRKEQGAERSLIYLFSFCIFAFSFYYTHKELHVCLSVCVRGLVAGQSTTCGFALAWIAHMNLLRVMRRVGDCSVDEVQDVAAILPNATHTLSRQPTSGAGVWTEK